jgi:hypothetical protein
MGDGLKKRCLVGWKFENSAPAGRRWLTPVILATQEVEIRRILVQSQSGQKFTRLSLGKPITKIELVEWLEV